LLALAQKCDLPAFQHLPVIDIFTF